MFNNFMYCIQGKFGTEPSRGGNIVKSLQSGGDGIRLDILQVIDRPIKLHTEFLALHRIVLPSCQVAKLLDSPEKESDFNILPPARNKQEPKKTYIVHQWISIVVFCFLVWYISTDAAQKREVLILNIDPMMSFLLTLQTWVPKHLPKPV